MKTSSTLKPGLTLLVALALSTVAAHSDTFGSGANAFTVGFVDVGNAGNANDPISGSIHGSVGYNYRISVTEVPQDWIIKATNLGLANVMAYAFTRDRPSVLIDWYEPAAFVNWLNTSTGHQAAYDLTYNGSWSMTLWSSAQAWKLDGENLYRHKDAYYFLPSEDEWYKAAYHKNDGVTGNYWLFATGSNTIPRVVESGTEAGTAVYFLFPGTQPANVDNAGGLSPYGTRARMEMSMSGWRVLLMDRMILSTRAFRPLPKLALSAVISGSEAGVICNPLTASIPTRRF